jgi:hypothetical protein
MAMDTFDWFDPEDDSLWIPYGSVSTYCGAPVMTRQIYSVVIKMVSK